MPTTDDVRETLKTVFDPEIGINIVDLGLIYDVNELDEPGGFRVTFQRQHEVVGIDDAGRRR